MKESENERWKQSHVKGCISERKGRKTTLKRYETLETTSNEKLQVFPSFASVSDPLLFLWFLVISTNNVGQTGNTNVHRAGFE